MEKSLGTIIGWKSEEHISLHSTFTQKVCGNIADRFRSNGYTKVNS